MENVSQGSAPNRWLPLGVLAVLIVGTVAAAFWWHQRLDSSLPEPQARPQFTIAVGMVRRSLPEKAGAQFQNLRGYGESTCGEVDARGQAGTYTGFRAFVVRPDSKAMPVLIDRGPSDPTAAGICAVLAKSHPEVR